MSRASSGRRTCPANPVFLVYDSGAGELVAQ